MKRLGVFVCILVASITIFGGFSSPKKVSAQTATPPSVDVYSYFHDNAILVLNNTTQSFAPARNAAQENLTTLSNAPKPDQKNIALQQKNIATLDIYITAMMSARDTYERTFAGSKNETDQTTLANAQIAAVNAAEKSALKSLNDNGVMSPTVGNPAGPLYQQFQGGLGGLVAQANAIIRGDATPNSPKANSLSNPQAPLTAGNYMGGQVSGQLQNCPLFDIICYAGNFWTWFIKTFLLEIAGVFLWAAANMFNYSINIAILNFSQWAPDTLYPIWIIVRQIVSLFLVFAGLYMGLMYILGKDEQFEHYIPWIIVFALFVNFSYPVARTAIDISNIVSLKIYTAVIPDALQSSSDPQSESNAGSIIVTRLGLKGLMVSTKKTGGVTTEVGQSDMFKQLNSVPEALLAVCYVFYAAWVFFMATGIMILRTAALVFITIVSPLLFVDAVIPVLGEKAKGLRKIFFEQLAVGPVFMILLALTLKFLEVFSAQTNKTVAVGGAVGTQTIATLFNILMMLIMLNIMMKVTKHLSGVVGEMATKAMGTVGGIGLGLATGGMGMLGRQAIGRGAAFAQTKGWVSKDPKAMSGRIANTLASSSFDLRNSKTVAGAMNKAGFGKGLLGMGGMSNGGSKKSFQAASLAKVKEIEERDAAQFKTTYERDVYGKDASGNDVILHRKGDTNVEETNKQRDFLTKQGSSRFLTAEHGKKITDKVTDAKSKLYMDDYSKLKTNEAKSKNFNELKEKLENAKKTDKSFSNPETQALMRSVTDIEKQRKDYDVSIQEKINQALKMSEERGKNFLASLPSEDRKKIEGEDFLATLSAEDRKKIEEMIFAQKASTEATRANTEAQQAATSSSTSSQQAANASSQGASQQVRDLDNKRVSQQGAAAAAYDLNPPAGYRSSSPIMDYPTTTPASLENTRVAKQNAAAAAYDLNPPSSPTFSAKTETFEQTRRAQQQAAVDTYGLDPQATPRPTSPTPNPIHTQAPVQAATAPVPPQTITPAPTPTPTPAPIQPSIPQPNIQASSFVSGQEAPITSVKYIPGGNSYSQVAQRRANFAKRRGKGDDPDSNEPAS